MVVTVSVALGCGGFPFGRDLVLNHEMEGAEREAAVALGDSVEGARFPESISGADEAGRAGSCATHGPAFVWLAARDDRPGVRTAALALLPGCLSALDPADVRVAARSGLASTDRPTLAAAFALAGVLLVDEPVDSPLLEDVLAATAAADPAVRYDAMTALDHRPWSDDPRAVAAFVGLLGAPQPWLVTEALRRVRYRAAGLEDAAPLAAAARPLLTDIDPGIRGRAALALARLSPDDTELAAVIASLLDDPHPYTRSAASEALADLAYVPAVHDLVLRLDDQSPNTWDLVAFTRLDGESVVQHHVGSLFERTDDAFLRALARLTEPMGDDRFVYREVHLGKWRDLDILAAGRDARSWYASHGDLVPSR